MPLFVRIVPIGMFLALSLLWVIRGFASDDPVQVRDGVKLILILACYVSLQMMLRKDE